MASHNEKSKKSGSGSVIVRRYLVAFNILSALGWSYVFFVVSKHLAGLTVQSHVPSPSVPPVETSALKRILGLIPYIQSSLPVSTQSQSQTPPASQTVLDRARTTFTAVGWQTAVVQSFAILEVFHALLGWVRSPVPTTAMQVASRLILVWGIAERYQAARDNPIYASMVLAWSTTEVIRYSFYAANRLQCEPRWLLWLRYNTFFVLYPIGAGSEAALIFSTLPPEKGWNAWDYGRASMFLTWWPGLYVMYTYMIKQRRKVLGGGTAKHVKDAKVN